MGIFLVNYQESDKQFSASPLPLSWAPFTTCSLGSHFTRLNNPAQSTVKGKNASDRNAPFRRVGDRNEVWSLLWKQEEVLWWTLWLIQSKVCLQPHRLPEPQFDAPVTSIYWNEWCWIRKIYFKVQAMCGFSSLCPSLNPGVCIRALCARRSDARFFFLFQTPSLRYTCERQLRHPAVCVPAGILFCFVFLWFLDVQKMPFNELDGFDWAVDEKKTGAALWQNPWWLSDFKGADI